MVVIATPQIDHVGETGKLVLGFLNGVTTVIADNLSTILTQVQANPNHSAQEFWDRQGTHSVDILQEFVFWRSILEAKAPEKITPEVALAGSTLQINEDGSITIP